MLLVVFLEIDNRVLSFRYLQVSLLGVRASVAQRVCLEASRRVHALQRIGVYRYEEVCFAVVRYVGALVQRNEHVGLACVYHSHVGAVLLHVSSESQRHVEVNVLLYRESARCSGVLSAVSWIYNECEFFICACHSRHKRYDEY